ncbi:MAG TPA: amino acid adenylation domain-containing protein [Ktedonobacteraceae bacterium]|nr:amino acid adenylation domain-containing protein [Ktedonobacteraceae bacterium]
MSDDMSYPDQRCFHELVAAQAQLTPDAIAVVQEGMHLTYQELNERANQLAHHLQSRGVGPERLVGICMERSLELIVGLLGILKAGGAYVPLAPGFPPERLAFMLTEAFALSPTSQRTAVLLCQQHLKEKLEAVPAEQVLCLSQDWAALAHESKAHPHSGVRPDNLAYVIYTSGSTGQPKGVMVAHSAIGNRLRWQQATWPLTASDRVLQIASFSFDIAIWEIFGPLCTGAQIILARLGGEQESRYLAQMLEQEQITVAHFVPSLLQVILEELDLKTLPDLKWVFCGGEKLPADLPKRFFAKLQTELHQWYGPTEAAISVTSGNCWPVEELNSVPLGYAITNAHISLLDSSMQPVPNGEVGEVYIGGLALGRGYFKRPELTAERFLPDPFATEKANGGARLYRTGDLGRYRADGRLEYMGRTDDQVKIRGHRIEPGEIATVLSRHPAVREAVVVARPAKSFSEKKNAGKAEEDTRQLIAYITTRATRPTARELRSYLQEKLPAYMIPHAFVALEQLPLTVHGKIDRQALPDPDDPALALERTDEYVAPRTPTEELLGEIWTQVLGIKHIGVHDNFFELGGHSLLVTRLISRIRHLFQTNLPVHTFFAHPTIAACALVLQHAQSSATAWHQPPLQPLERTGEVILSFAQQRLWFLDRLMPDLPFANISSAFKLTGELRIDVLRASLHAIVQRHESLRTTFVEQHGQPRQAIAPSLSLDLTVHDLQKGNRDQRWHQVEQFLAQETALPFDLRHGPLLRVHLLRLDTHEHVLVLSMHHIITDGWSMSVFWHELSVHYQALSQGQAATLPALPVQYADYTLWQRQWLQGDMLQHQVAYWKAHLAHLPQLDLPTDRPRPTAQHFQGRNQYLFISPELTATLKQLSQQEGVTLFMTLLATFQVLLARWSGQEDIAVGTPIAGRTHAELEPLIGFFVNTLVLRSDLSGQPTFRELLGRVRKMALEAYAHQELPFEQLVEELQPARDLNRNPLVQVLFALQNAPTSSLQLPEITIQPVEVEEQNMPFDLTMQVWEQEQGLRTQIHYNMDLFETETIGRLLAHWQVLLAAIVRTPACPITALPLLTPAEQQQLLVTWNATRQEYPCDYCTHQLFETQVAQTPDAVAVCFEGETLTYLELNRRANQLAHYLRERGVGAQTLVGICVERSLAMVIGLLGILKADAAYVPLDPAYPAERLAYMLQDARVAALLTTSVFLQKNLLVGEQECHVIYLDTRDEQEHLARRPVTNPVSAREPANLAYVIYTSGSTGKPKGVQVTQRGLCNLLSWHQQTFAVTRRDRATQLASLSFDAAGWEIWPYLTAGAALCLVENEVRDTLPRLRSWLELQAITVLFLPTPLAESFLAESWPGDSRSGALRLLLTGGDQLRRAPLEDPPFVFVNNYGPTENTVVTTSGIVEPMPVDARLPTIGYPIANTRVYVVDQYMQPVPVGVTGELYIGGDGLARGYLNQPELTAERFVPDPFSNQPGARLYKTGDLVRYQADGSLDFIGRNDGQVKVRGFRIEISEIETVLRQHAGVKEAVVMAREDTPGEKRLVAYIVPQSEAPLTTQQLRQHLQARLPGYMVPAAIVTLEQIPLSPNGKLDRRMLPAPSSERPDLQERYMPPQNALEERLAAIWAEILGIERIGIYDNFFELGGHSLLATQVIARIQSVFAVDLPLRSLFEQPVVAELAREIARLQDGRPHDGRPAPGHHFLLSEEENAERLLAQLDQLSAEEVDLLLGSLLSEQKENI